MLRTNLGAQRRRLNDLDWVRLMATAIQEPPRQTGRAALREEASPPTAPAPLARWERWLAIVLGLILLAAVAWQFLFQVTYAASMIEYHLKYLPCLLDGGLTATFDFNGLGDPRPRLFNSVLTLANVHLRRVLLSEITLHPAFGLNWLFYPLCLLLLYRVVRRLTDSPRMAVMSVLLYAASPALLDTLTDYYLPAKPVINLLVLAALYGACLMFPDRARLPRVKTGAAIVFAASLLGLLADETAVFIILCVPVIFWSALCSSEVRRSAKYLFAASLAAACLVFVVLAFVVVPMLNRACDQVPLDFWDVITVGPYQAMFGVNPAPLKIVRSEAGLRVLLETIVSVHAVPNRSVHGIWYSHRGAMHCYQWPWAEQIPFYLFLATVLVLLAKCARGRAAEWPLTVRLLAASGIFVVVEAVLVLRLQPQIIETNYYAALASLFFALIMGVLLGRLVSGGVARLMSWLLLGYLIVVQFTNFVDTAGRHPYIDRPLFKQAPLTWDELRTVRAQVAEGQFADLSQEYPFPTRRFLYAFECQAGRDYAAGRRIDALPTRAAGDNLLQTVHLGWFYDPYVNYRELFASITWENARCLFDFQRVEAKELAPLLLGKVVAGRSGNWDYLRTIEADGTIRQRFWLEGLLRVWPDRGTMHIGQDSVRMTFARMQEEEFRYAYQYQGVYYAFDRDGQLITRFFIKGGAATGLVSTE
jgi:hypothetical protein